jgi:hypothetical protein
MILYCLYNIMDKPQSNFYNLNPVNYSCPVCRTSGKLPNIAGRFFLINETECQCNGCNTKFNKRLFYKPHSMNAVNVKLEQPTI